MSTVLFPVMLGALVLWRRKLQRKITCELSLSSPQAGRGTGLSALLTPSGLGGVRVGARTSRCTIEVLDSSLSHVTILGLHSFIKMGKSSLNLCLSGTPEIKEKLF